MGWGLAVLGLCSGCGHGRPPFVAVPAAIYRTEVATTNRLALPLGEGERQFLLTFLQSGRNPTLDPAADIVAADASVRYAGLIELLSSSANLGVTNLVVDARFTPAPAFRPWFPERALRQIVDAHEEWPFPRPPYAFLEVTGSYWWVFYHERKRLTHVMVTRAVERPKPR